MKNAIGRANKFLHWTDMLYLKDCGVHRYDWGGIADPQTPNGIDKFKMSFGGEKTEYYNCTANVSFKAKLFGLLYKIMKK